VLVESVVVEVNDELAKDLGIEWKTNLSPSGTFVGGSTNSANLTTPTPPGIGPGLTLGFYSNDELRGFIRALETAAGTNILSRPTVVTLDNEEAEILIGENVPFITGSSTGSASPTDNPFTTIQRQDIGITLKVKPRINNENSVTLDITQTVEAIASSAVATADIVTSKRSIQTKVLIENDEVLVLGGLIRDELVEKKNKIPLLGDIPWLGRLFRSTSNQSIKKNLMVFIHPVVIRDSDIGREISRNRYDDFWQRQTKFNNKLDSYFAPKDRPQLPPLRSEVVEDPEQNKKTTKIWKKR
jgi:general secretion pathway protein D